ncbi:3,4-dihydroxy 2-butanone 4-phosphate synthase / GTP cyclohydrolase II [Alkalibacterium putridalgicola]|uniref:Riboflavin biosynthesis protein RibBA n=1 Tax=Alkalibacterium putridalgicola TaxID=426703 RepID=A0A1H7VXR3_9LACT|nr:bifunctional 3,4-dihydroxy-2-butanone-4-phosphate synthase/GTP cyclohydrolase II [Alkalibacterium putridalgicola]GEK89366.1 riboflavin biosynthesis protein RibBA [Alkalibacterium putridalgicola]SEM14033.1 3,4-dihydroxy 2-butanone 4-phosphate synthase / GTP cyclohydrolase II [Alkalibacterium putridalgicola]
MFDKIEDLLEDLKQGKNVIIVDDEDRENEGDFVCAAEFATPENVNFMAKYARGLICMPMTKEYTKKLGLPQMSSLNTDEHTTAFTISIDHADTTTGISAGERSLTAMKTVEEGATPNDFKRPGHMFPLEAVEGGVLARNGHTEATVDLMRLSGLKPVGLCCEIMNDDGSMARRDDLLKIAEEHDLKIGTITDLIEYRKANEELIVRESKAKLPTKYGDFDIYAYEHKFTGEHHVALVKGDVSDGEPVLTRIHSECLTGDVFGSKKCDCGEQLETALEKIAEEGRGVLVYMRQEGRGIGLVNKIKAYALQDQGHDTIEANLLLGLPVDAREYYECKQIFDDLGVSRLNLMTNNPIKISTLDKYGLKIENRIPIQTTITDEDRDYLATKKNKMGHYLDL